MISNDSNLAHRRPNFFEISCWDESKFISLARVPKRGTCSRKSLSVDKPKLFSVGTLLARPDSGMQLKNSTCLLSYR